MNNKVIGIVKKYKLLLENIFSLFAIRGLEYILSFITFPYLVRVLGPSLFGSIAFAQGIIQYFNLFTDYGFNLTGPRAIAQHDTVDQRGKTFSAIFSAKVFLLIIATFVFGIMSWLSLVFGNYDLVLFFVVYIGVIGNVVFPVWFFQGIQQMRYITLVNTIARFISVVGIFMLVKSEQNYVMAAFLQAIPSLIAGIISWIILKYYYPETLCLSSWDDIKNTLKDSWGIFTSTVAINIYTASNIVILGFMTNSTIVGYFSGAQKIIQCVQRVLEPISQAIYPHISKQVENDKAGTVKFIKKILYVLGGGNLLISLVLLGFAPIIVRILLGPGYEASITMLRILSFLPFVIALSNVFGIQTMLPFGMENEFSKILMCSALLNTIIVFPLIFFFSGNGVCISMLITECFVTFSMWYVLRKKNIIDIL